jgi:ankyrin repeat protein
MSEPVLKKQKLGGAGLCACTNLSDAARQRHIKCVAKYITDIDDPRIKSSILLSVKHEPQESQHKGCTECVAALLAAGASVEPAEWAALSPVGSAVAVAAGAGCTPCLTKLLAQADSLTTSEHWVSPLKQAICILSVELMQMLLDTAPAHMSKQLLQVALLDVCGMKTLNGQRRTSLMVHLLERGACVNTPSAYDMSAPLEIKECTALGLLARGDCCADIEMLVTTQKADINLKFGDCKCTALHVACTPGTSEQQGVAAVVQKLAELGAELYAVTADGSTVLHLAVKAGSLAALRALAPLLQAAAAADVSMHTNLLACKDGSGCTPLHLAVSASRDAEHCREVLAVLLSLNSEHLQCALAKADKQGNTALHIAIEQHKFALLQQLLVASSKLGCVGALLDSTGAAGADCWLMARRAGAATLTELLAPYAASAAAATAGDPSSSAAIATGAAVRTSSTASAGDLDCINVHTAVSRAHMSCLKLLLARSPSAAAEITSSKQTALHLVDHSKQNCDQITAALLSACPTDERYSIVNTADADGKTALHLCASEHAVQVQTYVVCHKCMRAMLAAAGTDTAAQLRYDDGYGCEFTVLEVVLQDAALWPLQSEAALAESISTVQALLAAGCTLDQQLSRALEYQQGRAAVRVLLACGADPFERNEQGCTAMHAAAAYEACNSDSAAADKLAEVPVNVLNIQDLCAAAGAAAFTLVNSMDYRQSTPLHFAADQWPAAVRALLQFGAIVDVGDADGCTALHLACSADCFESVELLLAAGASVHARSNTLNNSAEGQWSPLHYAAARHQYPPSSSDAASQIVSLLLSQGASINDLTTGGCSALWLLARYGTSPYTHAHLKVRWLVELGATVAFYSEVHGSLLHAAAAGGNSKMLQELLDCGVRLDDSKRDASLRTPLHTAAAAGHAAVVLQLLQLGADVSAVDRDGNTALRVCMQGRAQALACCTMLIQAGSDVFNVAPESR